MCRSIINKAILALLLNVHLLAATSVLGGTATFTPVGPTTVEPGTDVIFDVTLSVGMLAEFNTADILIGSDDATNIAFSYSAEWAPAFASVTDPIFDTGTYAQDVFVGGNNATPVGASIFLGIVTVSTIGLNPGTYSVAVDNNLDGISTLGLAGQPEALNGAGEFIVGQVCTTSICRAPQPHDIRKNRYLSVDPRGAGGVNVGQNFDIKITLITTLVDGVTAVGSVWWANAPDANCVSIVGPTLPAVPPNWDACPTLHLTGCPIIPTSAYEIVVVVGGSESGTPLVAETQRRPADDKWWGDAVGMFNGTQWTGPQGVTNFDDVTACLKTFQDPNAINATHTSITDIHPNQPTLPPPANQINRVVNIDDVFNFIKGFQGDAYPGPDIHLCPDP